MLLPARKWYMGFCTLILALLVCLVSVTALATPNGMVILHTDYGADSVYVGMLKGAIYNRFPEARIDTFTNSIPPFDIALGAQMLEEGAPYYPAGTVFCCVVDPGVGTERRGIVIETESGHYFVAPDNGLLTGVINALGARSIHVIENRAYWRDGRESTTFHGRDIFGPVAASIASGVALAEIGDAIDAEQIFRIEIARSEMRDNIIYGQVMRVDEYGNVVTNVPETQVENLGIGMGDSMFITLGEHAFSVPLVRTYAEVPPGDRLACVQSFNLIELAVNMDSLANQIGAQAHMPLTIRKENDTLIDYRRSGGTLRYEERLVIQRDGTAFAIRAQERAEKNIERDDLDNIQALLEALNWDEPARVAGAPIRHGADYYAVHLHYNGRNIHVTSLNLPEPLSPILDLLNALFN